MTNFKENDTKDIYIDLATEAHRFLRGDGDREIEGVSQKVTQKGNQKITEITILNEKGAEKMQRPIGNYLTIDAPSLFDDTTAFLPCAMEISAILRSLIKEEKSILLCGLGNPDITADALGPKVAAASMATRHLFRYMADQVEEGFGEVSLIAPDVMGNTGLEAAEIIKGTIEESHAELLLVIDALAAMEISRIGTSFQITDTGIVPGSGLKNHRNAINHDTMGIPVIAIDVPTVVQFATIIREIRTAIKGADDTESHGEAILRTFSENPLSYAVTPKDIDTVIDGIADVLTVGIHMGLHPKITAANYSDYLNLSGALL